MRPISRLAAAALLMLAVTAPGFAQEDRRVIRPSRHHFVRCLAILDLSADQRSQIQAFVDAARPALESDLQALRTAGETLRADLGVEPPDACLIGNDALAVQAARQTLAEARQALRDQIESVLTPEQQIRFEGCLDFSWLPDGDALNDLLSD
jgi:Spy/CpxP family protein refolding chaperone